MSDQHLAKTFTVILLPVLLQMDSPSLANTDHVSGLAAGTPMGEGL